MLLPLSLSLPLLLRLPLVLLRNRHGRCCGRLPKKLPLPPPPLAPRPRAAATLSARPANACRRWQCDARSDLAKARLNTHYTHGRREEIA